MNGWWHHGLRWSVTTPWGSAKSDWCNGWTHWSGRDEPGRLDLIEVGNRVVYAWARERR